MSKTPTTLAGLCERYALTRGLRDGSIYQYDRLTRLFSQYLERDAALADLNDETVSRFLAWLQTRKYSKNTVHRYRAKLLSVWRDCAMRELCEPPRFVRRVPKKQPCPIAWSEEELARIARCTLELLGNLSNGAPRWLYFSALFHTAYETGLRRGDLWALRREQFRADGVVILEEMQKTGWPHIPQVSREVLNAIQRLPGERPLAWPYKGSSTFYRQWRRSIIVPTGVRRGALHQIRRSGATWLAKSAGVEAARKYLAHRTDSMVWHYVDRSVAFGPAPSPPRIGTSGGAL